MRSALSIVAACALAAVVVPTAQWRLGATATPAAGEPRVWGAGASAARVRHYVFFGRDRDALRQASSFLRSKSFEGAQVVYSWRQLASVYAAAVNLKVGVGGPDLLPYRKGQQNHSYPLIAAAAGSVPTGIAVQEGNYEDRNPASGARVQVAELLAFATEQLRVEYLFWGTQEPFYSRQVLPLVFRAGD
jgi:hypothetical protein